jgi:hypothetical protein
MTELYLIQGGRNLSDAFTNAAIAEIPFEALLTRPAAEQFAARAEQDASAAVAQVTAAIAVLAKGKTNLVSLIAAAGPEQAADGHAALQRACRCRRAGRRTAGRGGPIHDRPGGRDEPARLLSISALPITNPSPQK